VESVTRRRLLAVLASAACAIVACESPRGPVATNPPRPTAAPAGTSTGPVAPSSGAIVLGMSAAFRGPSRGLGIELYRGSMAYLEDVGRAGGVDGRQITIKPYDDGYEPTPAVRNTIRLVEHDRAFALFNYVGTPTVTRVLPLLKQHRERHVYLLFPFTGAQPHREPPYAEYVLNLRASYRQETQGLVERLASVGRRRIGVFYQADAYGRSGWDGVRRALRAYGLEMSAEATYRRGTSYSESMREQVEILRAAAPDAIISIGAYEACAAFIRDARDAGWGVPIANVSFVGSESLLALLMEMGENAGRDYTTNLINSQVVPSYDDTSLPAVREYREAIDRLNPMPPADLVDGDYESQRYSFVSFEGFLNAKLAVEVIRRMGGQFDRARLREVAESIRGLDIGIGAPVSFGGDRHQGLDIVYYTTVDQGRFVPIVDWGRWAQ
jgi:branched-chain amino acid transport system substrate-binding protein